MASHSGAERHASALSRSSTSHDSASDGRGRNTHWCRLPLGHWRRCREHLATSRARRGLAFSDKAERDCATRTAAALAAASRPRCSPARRSHPLLALCSAHLLHGAGLAPCRGCLPPEAPRQCETRPLRRCLKPLRPCLSVGVCVYSELASSRQQRTGRARAARWCMNRFAGRGILPALPGVCAAHVRASRRPTPPDSRRVDAREGLVHLRGEGSGIRHFFAAAGRAQRLPLRGAPAWPPPPPHGRTPTPPR